MNNWLSAIAKLALVHLLGSPHRLTDLALAAGATI